MEQLSRQDSVFGDLDHEKKKTGSVSSMLWFLFSQETPGFIAVKLTEELIRWKWG
jgi:hypothetical protein